MKSFTKKLKMVLVICMICIPAFLFAQGGPDDFPDDVQDTPFDGGISLLVAAGIGYGVKKAYEQRKQQNA